MDDMIAIQASVLFPHESDSSDWAFFDMILLEQCDHAHTCTKL
jgi:hypothetical protein